MKLPKNWLYAFVVGLGLLSSLGFVIGSLELRGIGAAIGSSPLPIVFTTVKGLETFSSSFYLEFKDGKKIKITPDLYSKLRGPYNYRNAIGAAIAYGPLMEEELRLSVYNHFFCEKSMLQLMGAGVNVQNFEIIVVPRFPFEGQVEWRQPKTCKP